MKKIFVCLFLIIGIAAFSQTTVGEPDADKIGTDVVNSEVQSITVETFEDPGLWKSSIPMDLGMMELRRREGSPDAREKEDADRMAADAENGIPPGKNVIGAKVTFYQRAMTEFSVVSVRPLPIPGICKTVSVWVVGRNFNHRLKLLVQDYFGNRHELSMGKLNFSGWKKMTVVIPPSITQWDYHYTAKAGIKILGFKVECELMETYGTFYIYFDDLSAYTDLFVEEFRDPDDISDDW
ncbi:MAG: flagellar filament protein FlaA [Spirochaetales bacterium]|nr:flagellar filament protein FlaA [Spirochaetales bacterium]